MPDKSERTILMHEDSSKENWKTPTNRAKKRLRERASIENFSVEYKTDSIGTWTLGGIKSNRPKSPGQGNTGGGLNLGLKVEKEF